MSVSRHHADWLSLIEASGPFVSLPVLLRSFPQGLDPRDPVQAKVLRSAYEDWQKNPNAPGQQRSWITHVLTGVVGYPPELIAEGQELPAGVEAKMPEQGEVLRPHLALIAPAGTEAARRAQLLVTIYPVEQALDRPVVGKHWKANPATRMMELLHGADVPLGLVTNGEQWMLVFAPRGETTGYASWSAGLWLDEPITLRAFHSLLGIARFFGVAADDTLLAMLKASAEDQQEVTDQLGYQVREAVEVLVRSLDALDRESHRALLKDVPETVLYDAVLTVMMRLVFLFSAEERGLLHLGKPLYDDNYAVSTLQEQLQEVADRYGEEVLERRYDAWTRLLSTFRAVHGGIRHQDLLMPAYGGSLFDPDRYPFLEGRVGRSSWRTTAAEPLAVNNRVVLHLLNSLQRLQVRVPGGGSAESRRISFRALGVEQIGHVYEGLLDRTAVRASEPILGVKGTRDKEREISLATLESLAAQGQDKLLEFLKEETGRSLSALRRALDEINLLDEHKLLIACGHDPELLERIRPFGNLVREDSSGRPVLTLADGIYVSTAGMRRSTGTHYTPPSLTEPVVQHTLEPLIYEGPVEGAPREQWKLKSPQAILDLKVCDMAMGSGAFLVQACRYMAERLVEAWENLEKQNPGQVLVTPEGTFSSGSPAERLVPADANERITIARRLIADRCLYGVDINLMAVEMAKLSLWLVTVQRDRPFTFVDHALKCGDSLLGVSSIKQIERFSLRPDERQVTFATANLSRCVEEASAKRRSLEGLPSNDQLQIEAKSRLLVEAEAATAKVKALADCLIALEMCDFDGKTYTEERVLAAEYAEVAMVKPLQEFQAFASEKLRGRRTFHWPLDFPEVFVRGGFDAFVGNPPFMGGQKITGAMGVEYRRFLVRHIAEGRKGSADLSVFFMLNAARLSKCPGAVGLVLTSAIAEGDNREVGLEFLKDLHRTVFRADTSRPWPGGATVTYSAVWFVGPDWRGGFKLNGRDEAGITSYLTPLGAVAGKPYRLKANTGKSFIGHYVLGLGFLMELSKAEELIARNSKNREVLFPFLNGSELNATWNSLPVRWTINFRQWPLSKMTAPSGYTGPVAEDYPDCLDIVRQLVKPERDRNKRDRRRERWWLFGDYAPSLEKAMQEEKLMFAISWTAAKHISFCKVERGVLLSHMLAVLALDRWAEFGVISSSLHDVWTRNYTSYNLALPRYVHTDCFLTFPFPALYPTLDEVSERYYSCRLGIMRARNEGSTDTYNRFHDPN
jgi:hypothetical protein